MIINDHKDFEVMIEGHTDNRPIAGYCMKDNWDLSAQRAIAVVRTLQDNYQVDPARMIAGARAEYQPKGDNETAEEEVLTVVLKWLSFQNWISFMI